MKIKLKAMATPSRLQPKHRSPFRKGVTGNPRGRPKGARGKKAKWREDGLIESGLTPLQFMLDVLRRRKYAMREHMWAAEKAAPYCHRKKPIAIEGGETPISVVDAAALAALPDREVKSLMAIMKKIRSASEAEDDA